MATLRGFQVVYLWRGERHLVLEVPERRKMAQQQCDKMLAAGWRAWIEPVVS